MNANLCGNHRHNSKDEPLARIIRKVTGVSLCALALLCVSCDLIGDLISNDNLPTHFEPVDWNDNMIFLATDQGPPQAQIWDTETRMLVRKVVFPEYMFFGNPLVTDGERMWINLVSIAGKKETARLIQLDAINGKISVINLDIKPNEIQFINGVLWVFDPYNTPRNNDVRFRRFDRNGKLQQSVTINLNGIGVYHVGQDSIVYVDGDYLIPLRTNHDRFYIANLSKGGMVTEIPLETLFPGGLLENFSTVVYDPRTYPPDPSQSGLRFYEEGYADVIFPQAKLIWRWYYKIESYTPFKLSGPLITYHRHGDRSNLFLSRTDEHLFVGGFFNTRRENIRFDDESLSGIEIGVYPVEGGEELMFFRLSQANNHYVKRSGEIWIGKDIWTFDHAIMPKSTLKIK